MEHQDAPCFSIDDVEVLDKQCVYDGFFKMQRYKLRHKLMEGGWSQPLVRECLVRSEAVAVLLYDPYKDTVVLLEQFRIGTLDAHEGPWQMELVAGIVDEGEKLEDVAYREAQEETGADVLDLEYIYEFYASAGGSNEKITLYCGGIDSTGMGGVHGIKSEGEDIWVQVFSREEAMQALSENYISNAIGIIGLQWLQMNWERLQKKWQ